MRKKAIPIKLTPEQAGRILRVTRTITALAKDLGCSRLTVSAVLRGRATSARITKAAIERAGKIAAELGAA